MDRNNPPELSPTRELWNDPPLSLSLSRESIRLSLSPSKDVSVARACKVKFQRWIEADVKDVSDSNNHGCVAASNAAFVKALNGKHRDEDQTS